MKKIIVILAALILLVSIVIFSNNSKSQFGKSFIENSNGIKILHLYGSPSEMGKAVGSILKEDIQALINNYIKVIFSNKKHYLYALKRAKTLSKHIPKEYLAEIKGISETSQISFDDLLIANCFLDMKESALCSTYVVHKEKSSEDNLMLARNLEFKSLGILEQHDIIIVYHHKNKQKLVSIGWPGLIGVVSGYNEAGLTAAMLVSLSEKRKAYNHIPSTMAFRELLENKTSVKEAVSYFKKVKTASANNLTVVDSNNQSAVFELSPINGMKYRKPDGNILSCTNFFRKGKNKKLGRRDQYLLSVKKHFNKGHQKYNVDNLKDILKSAAILPINIQSMIFIPGKAKLFISMKDIPAVSGDYTEFDLTALMDK